MTTEHDEHQFALLDFIEATAFRLSDHVAQQQVFDAIKDARKRAHDRARMHYSTAPKE